MNVAGIPLADNSHGFVWVAGSLLALTTVLANLVLGRRRD